jgi:hypothetical protein
MARGGIFWVLGFGGPFAFALAACVELKAVTATSHAGESLATYEEQVGLLDETCRFGRVLNGATKCPKDTAKWQRALAMLVAYSKGLDAAAAGKAPSAGDAVGSALGQAESANWVSLSTGAQDAVQKVASGVVAFLAREATRASIQQAIRDVGPSLDTVVQLLASHLALELEYLLGVRCQVACEAGQPFDTDRCPDTPPQTCQGRDAARSLWFIEFEERLDAQDAALRRASAALQAFGKAHKHLYDEVEHLDADALYKAVVEDITFTVSAVTADGGSTAEGGAP